MTNVQETINSVTHALHDAKVIDKSTPSNALTASAEIKPRYQGLNISLMKFMTEKPRKRYLFINK